MDFLRSLTLFVLLFAGSCAEALPLPELGPHVDEEPVIVPYPPPAARASIIVGEHGAQEVWVDGQWIWRSRRWIWQAGGFLVPPPDSYYAPPVTLRTQDGSLAYFEGGFRRRKKPKQTP